MNSDECVGTHGVELYKQQNLPLPHKAAFHTFFV